MTSGAGTPASSAPPGQPLEVGGELRAQVGVGDGGREALVLAELGEHLARQRDVEVRERFPYRFADLLLVLGVQEREQQADRDGVDLGLPQRVDGLLHAVLVERLELAVGPHPLLHREAQIPRHERLRAPLGEVVERRAVLAGELDQVAEALGRDQRGARAAALEQRVGGDRHPVRERGHVAGLDRLQRAHHTLGLIVGRARHLARRDAGSVEGHEVRERAAHIDADSDHLRPISTKMALGHGLPSFGLVQYRTRDSAREIPRFLRMPRVVER